MTSMNFVKGFSAPQAEAAVELVSQVMAANAEHMNKNLVTKPHQVTH